MLTLTKVITEAAATVRPIPEGLDPAPAAGIDDTSRVWLTGRGRADGVEPSPSTWLRDGLMRTWVPTGRGTWFTTDGRHQATLAELRERTDLVEVTR